MYKTPFTNSVTSIATVILMTLYYMMVNMAVLLTGRNIGISVLVGVAGVKSGLGGR